MIADHYVFFSLIVNAKECCAPSAGKPTDFFKNNIFHIIKEEDFVLMFTDLIA